MKKIMAWEKGVETNDDFELITDLIGAEAALKIAKAFVGSYIYVPKRIFTTMKYNSIRREYEAGSTYCDLCVKYKYSESHIRHIIHGTKTSVKGANAT